MTPEFRFVCACTGISLIITHIWWCYFRAWILRARLFEIRDNLWDAMREKGTFDDPEHRDLREVINALIRAASSMTWVSFLLILITHEGFQAVMAAEPKMPEVRQARAAVGQCIANYLLKMTLPGLLILTIARMFNVASDLKRSLAQAASAMVGVKAFCQAGA